MSSLPLSGGRKALPRVEPLGIDKIQFIEEFYPRNGLNPEIVNQYMLNLDALPPITLTKKLVLVDGYHRLTAYRNAGRTEIKAELIDISDDRILIEATKRNALHGRQLTIEEKRCLSHKFYKLNDGGKKVITQEEIADLLAVAQNTVSTWLKEDIETTLEARNKQIFELWLAGKTQEDIADKMELSQPQIVEIIGNIKDDILENPPKPKDGSNLYNVWYFPDRDPSYGLDEYPGRIPGQIVENVLYYHTEPFDLVVDPTAGGGTTIDVCKAMARRWLAYDLKPVREDITQRDITKGYPSKCKKAKLIFLDPPYFNMVFDDYKNIDEFYKFIKTLAKNTHKIANNETVVSLLMQDMTEKGKYCLSGECYRIFRDIGFECIDHISCPVSTQQFSPQQVNEVKKERRLLGRNRDLYVFKKGETHGRKS